MEVSWILYKPAPAVSAWASRHTNTQMQRPLGQPACLLAAGRRGRGGKLGALGLCLRRPICVRAHSREEGGLQPLGQNLHPCQESAC